MENGEYRGRTAVITGAGSGLGAAMADLFAAAGANLVLLDIDGDRADEKARELGAQGVNVLALQVDVANRESLSRAANAVLERFGACHVLCCNVGVQQFGAIDKLSDNDWSWVLSVNVMGTINTVAAFLPLLRKGDRERHIVLTASASVFQPAIRMAAYVTTKHAVVGYGEVLRRELAGEGINVAMLFPAGMTTRHLESSALARPGELGKSRLEREDIDAMMADADIDNADHLASAEHAVRNLLDDLRANHAYIFTHGNYRHQIEERQRDVIAAFDRMLASS